MPDIHITRKHALGLAAARKLAFRWAEEAEERLGMKCVYEEGETADSVTFTRSGVDGELQVTKDGFVLDAKLGLLLGAFRQRIETEIVTNLDMLLSTKDPVKSFDKGLAEHDSKRRPSKKKA